MNQEIMKILKVCFDHWKHSQNKHFHHVQCIRTVEKFTTVK